MSRVRVSVSALLAMAMTVTVGATAVAAHEGTLDRIEQPTPANQTGLHAGKSVTPPYTHVDAARDAAQSTSPLEPVDEAPFPDVPLDHPFVTEIAWMVREGITTGYIDGTFRPTATVSRQALAAFFFRLDGQEGGGPCEAGSGPFSDVSASHPFCQEITWLTAEGITTGYGDGTYRPSATVSRQAIITFIYRYHRGDVGHTTCVGDEGPFNDVGPDHPFCEPIRWATSFGDPLLANGYDDGTFRPTGSATRQAASAFIARYRVNVPPEMNVFEYIVGDNTVEVEAAAVTAIAEVEMEPVQYEEVLDEQGELMYVPVAPAVVHRVVSLDPDSEIPAVGEYFFLPPGHPEAPAGLVGEVIDLEYSPLGYVIVEVGPAALDEVFEDLYIRVVQRVEAEDLGQATEMVVYTDELDGGAAGNALAAISQATPGAGSWNLPKGTCNDDSQSFTAKFTLGAENLWVDQEVSIGWRGAAVDIDITWETYSSREVGGAYGIECSSPAAFERTYRIRVPLGLTGVELGIYPYFSWGATVNGTIKGDYRDYHQLTFSLDDDKPTGYTKTSDVQYTFSGGINLWAEAGVGLDVGVLGVTGIYVKLGLKAEASSRIVMRQYYSDVCLDFTVSAVGRVGFFLKAWVVNLEHEVLTVNVVLTNRRAQHCFTMNANADPDDYDPTAPSYSGYIPPVQNASTIRAALLQQTSELESAIEELQDALEEFRFTRDDLEEVASNHHNPDERARAAGYVAEFDELDTYLLDTLNRVQDIDGQISFASVSSLSTLESELLKIAAGVTDGDRRVRSFINRLSNALHSAYVPQDIDLGDGGFEGPVIDVISGQLWSIGYGETGASGTDSEAGYEYPQTVTGLPLVKETVQCDLGAALTGAIATNGSLWLWGSNDYGQLGRGFISEDEDEGDGEGGSESTLFAAGAVPDLSSVHDVFFDLHCESVFAVTASGTLYAWGRNDNGQLGLGHTNPQSSPAVVSIPGRVVDMESHTGTTLALTDDGSVYGWGSAARDWISTVDIPPVTLDPVVIEGLPPVVDIASNYYETALAVGADGSVWQWGTYHFRDGNSWSVGTTQSRFPVQVRGVENVREVHTVLATVYALSHDGLVISWGPGWDGGSGRGHSSGGYVAPGFVPRIPPITDLVVKYNSVHALGTDGTVWSWGHNASPQALAQGDSPDRRYPGRVAGLTDVTEIAGGPYFGAVYALRPNGEVWAWGGGDGYTYGDGRFWGWDEVEEESIDAPPVPVRVHRLGNGGSLGASISWGLVIAG